jgi:hypothetical protein
VPTAEHCGISGCYVYPVLGITKEGVSTSALSRWRGLTYIAIALDTGNGESETAEPKIATVLCRCSLDA